VTSVASVASWKSESEAEMSIIGPTDGLGRGQWSDEVLRVAYLRVLLARGARLANVSR
jgi:hypothetical protein